MTEGTTTGHSITAIVTLPEEVATEQTSSNVPNPTLVVLTGPLLGCRWESGDGSPCCRCAGGGDSDGGKDWGRGGAGGVEELDKVERKDVGDEVETVVE